MSSQVELKKKYKYRLILDESISFGSVGRTGRGLTELYNVPVSTLFSAQRSVCAEGHHRPPRLICSLGQSRLPLHRAVAFAPDLVSL